MRVESTSSEGIAIRREGPTVTVILDNPAVRNRISTANIEFLRKVIGQVNDDTTVRLFILTAMGKCFCSGFDLKALPGVIAENTSKAPPEASMDSGDLDFEALTDELEQLRCPTICGLNGSVYGAGADLALACDLRIGVTGSKLLIPAAKIGLHYPLGAIQRLVSKLGPTIAKRLLLGAEKMEGPQLVAIGFLDEIVEPELLDARIEELSARYAEMAPLAVEAMKHAINHFVRYESVDDAMLQRYLACLNSEDLHAGVDALLTQSSAQFKRR